MFLGSLCDTGKPLRLGSDLFQRHLLIQGQSATSKTALAYALLEKQTAEGGGWLYIDSAIDREHSHRLAALAKEHGRSDEFHVIDLDAPEASETYSPLINGSPEEVAARLMAVVGAPLDMNSGVAHYHRQIKTILCLLLEILQAASLRFTLWDLVQLLSNLDSLRALAQRQPAGSRAAQQLTKMLSGDAELGVLDLDSLTKFLNNLASRLFLYTRGKLGQVLNTATPTADLAEMVKSGAMCYVMLPVMGKCNVATTFGRWVTSDFMSVVRDPRSTPPAEVSKPPFLIIADELQAYAPDDLGRLFEHARAAGVVLVPMESSFVTREGALRDHTDVLLGSTWTKMFCRQEPRFGQVATEIMGSVLAYPANVKDGPPAARPRVSLEDLSTLKLYEFFVASGGKVFQVRMPDLPMPEEAYERPVREGRLPAGLGLLRLAP